MREKVTNEELVTLIQNGKDKQENLKQLYYQNFGMIKKIVQRYSGRADIEDLRQEAFFGVAAAAEMWRPDNGASFMTYCVYWIKQVVHRYIENCGGVIRVPVYRRARILKYNRTMNEFRVMFGRNPTACELATALEISAEQLEDLKKDVAALRIRSTSEPVGTETDSVTIEDTLPAEGDPIGDVIDRIQAEELAAVLWEIVEGLGKQEAFIIRSRFKDGKTLKDCGEEMGITPERARVIQANAILKIRQPKYYKKLTPYLNDVWAYRCGLQGTGLSTFKHTGMSAQERIMIRMEELTALNIQ